MKIKRIKTFYTNTYEEKSFDEFHALLTVERPQLFSPETQIDDGTRVEVERERGE